VIRDVIRRDQTAARYSEDGEQQWPEDRALRDTCGKICRKSCFCYRSFELRQFIGDLKQLISFFLHTLCTGHSIEQQVSVLRALNIT